MSKTLPGLKPWPADQPLPTGAVTIFYDPATNDEYGVHPARLGGAAKPAPVPPASYAQTLRASKTQVAGIVVSFPGPQTLEVTPIPGVSGGLVTLQLLDTSDNNSVTTADALSGYAAADAFYKFRKKNGDTHEAQWPATDTTLAV